MIRKKKKCSLTNLHSYQQWINYFHSKHHQWFDFAFFNILWKVYRSVQCLLIISTSQSLPPIPSSTPAPVHLQSLIFLITHWVQLMLPLYHWVWGHPKGNWQYSMWPQFKEEYLSCPQWSQTDINSLARGGSLLPARIFNWLDFVQITIAIVSWNVYTMSCWEERFFITLFPILGILHSFLFLF